MQNLDHLGVFVHRPTFPHGQLYVVKCRETEFCNLKINVDQIQNIVLNSFVNIDIVETKTVHNLN